MSVPPLSPQYTPQLIKQVKQIMSSANKSGELLLGWHSIKETLGGAGLAWTQRIPVDQVGVSPHNRGGMGVAAADAQKHLEDIVSVGFTWSKSECVAVHVEPGAVAERQFNNRQVSLGQGLIPALAGLQAVSIGGSHTNVGLRMVKARVRSLHKRLCRDGSDDRIDPDWLCNGRPQFEDALKGGLSWLVLQHEAERAWPGLSDFVQRALNVEVRGARSEIEVATDMWKMALLSLEKKQNPDWGQIEAEAAKALPPCAPYIRALSMYLQAHTGDLLQDLSEFLKAFERNCCSAALGGEFLQAVSELGY